MVRKRHYHFQRRRDAESFLLLRGLDYNLTRPVRSLRREVNDGQRTWEPRSSAMATGLTDHIWIIGELMMMVAILRLARIMGRLPGLQR